MEEAKTRYRYQGKIIGVMKGLGEQWIVAWSINDWSRHRVKSPSLPACETADECQRNLDTWAIKRGLQIFDVGGAA